MTFESTYVYDALHPHFQQRVRLNEPLALHSSFGVGGSADIWLTVETREELQDLISRCAQQRWPLLVVGAGSNILFADTGVRGIVASMAMSHFSIEKRLHHPPDAAPDGSALLIAEAGVHWATVLEQLAPSGWGGLEFAVGIPGTLGAGLISNVGAHNLDVGQVLEWIEVLDARGCNRDEMEPQVFPVIAFRHYEHDDVDLSYRHSRFRNNRLTCIDEHGQWMFPQRKLIEPSELVIMLALRLHRQDPALLAAQLEKNVQDRKQVDPEQRHLGSIFKDPSGNKAKKLIEQAGMAGKMHGNAQISRYNANYIVNLGKVSAADIATLIMEAHQHVLAQSGIQLALNVELLGEWQGQVVTDY